MAISIHPMWPIEEKDIINFVEVKLNWEITPINIDKTLISIISFHWTFFIKITIGAIFCQVSKIARLSHLIFLAMLGSQIWNGAIAILIAKAIIIIMDGIIMEIFILVISSLDINLNNKILEAEDWIRKYFIALSFDQLFFL